ncbi:MAG: HAMP domain-containing histidine kinase [Fibrobacter sp.]|jgi:signal transduction histidine kinase|nr:HAMP domain-containing histidine kinase [Fibrobacter sp.]
MKRLKLIFSVIFVVIAVPIAFLLVNSYRHLQNETQYAQREHAYLIIQILNQRIYDDLAIEEKRSYSEYRFIQAVPVIGGEEVTLSKLSQFPIESHYSGMLGHFQLDPDGGIRTPVLPDGILEKIPVENRREREAVRDTIQKVLKILNISNKGLERTYSAPPQDSLDRLYGEDIKLAVKLNEAREARRFNRRLERSTQKETFIFEVESAQIRKISEKDSTIKEEAQELYFPDVMEIAIDPFQAKFNDKYLVFYRNIWRNNKQFIQGYAVRLNDYFRKLIQREPLSSSEGTNLILEFGTKTSPYAIFGNKNVPRRELISVPLQAPLNQMQLTIYMSDMPAPPGTKMIIAIGILMYLILGGILIGLYKMIRSQLRLASKRQDFISAVSHELKTPLTAIRMYAELLQNSWVANEQKRQKYYESIASETERLSRLIQNVLNLSKLERNSWHIQLKKLNPKVVLEEFVNTYSKNIEKQGFDLTVSSDACDYEILMDKDAVMQVLMNVVDNSLKFAKSAHYKMIVLELRVTENVISLSIRDYGPGIPSQEMNRVFDEFYRVENEMTRTTVGTGIGLSMVKRLCELTGMQVSIENAVPGLRTIIRFPPISF